MKRNVASQTIGAELIDASTGGAFSGSVTVYVTGDNGSQTIGSVGSGACTHKGNGYHSYAPAQAETDYSHIAFTFVGSGAVPVTVQVYPDSAADIAAAVWDEDLSGYTTDGTAGKALSDADVRGSRTVVRGTVGNGSTPTSIVTSAFDPAGAAADQFKGRIVVFDNDTATAALRGQATDITANTNAAAPTLSVTSLTTAPSSGDTFSVL